MSQSNLILIPQGAVVPEELRLARVPKGDFVGAIMACREGVVMYEAGSRELQCLVEYRDLLDVEITAVIGLSGSMYSTIWNTYVSTMRRTTVDQLLADQSEQNDRQSNAGQVEETNPFVRASNMREVKSFDPDAPTTVADDDKTGDL